MTANPTNYPLAWPAGRPRTPAHRRQFGIYKSDGKPITTAVAMDRLDDEVRRLGGQYALLSSNVETTLAGRPRSGAAQPDDPGVCVYFTLKGQPFALACDTFTRVEQNIAALAAHIEATRRIDRLGVASAKETLQAFAALPPPGAGSAVTTSERRPWFEVLQVAPACSEQVIQASYRALAKTFADDEAKLRELNIARDEALKVLAS